MARTRQTARQCKRNYIWLQNWSRVPKSSEINLEDYFKWLLKYYPKKSRDLNLLTQTTQRIESYKDPMLVNPFDPPEELPQEKFNLKEARNRVIRRYKQDYYRHFKIDTTTRDKRFNKPVCNAETVVLSQSGAEMRISELYLKRILVNNVNLKTLEISNYYNFNSPQFLIRCLKYSRSAKTLTIQNVPFVPLRLWKYLIVDCHPYLESFTIEGRLADEYFLDELKPLTQMMEIVFGMKFLKRFQFDVKIPANYEFGLKKIPFYKLKNKQVSCDIRIPSSNLELDISEINFPILKDLDFLALNNKAISQPYLYLWHDIAKHHLACQEQGKNRLFLNVSPTIEYDIPSLLQSCSNISVLDLSLVELHYPTPDLSGIPKLYNLRHLFIAIGFQRKICGELFSNLAQALQGNTVLSSIALELQSSQAFENVTNSDAFFGACANTVTTLSVNFAEENTQGVKNFYQSIRQLNNLRNFRIQMSSLLSPSNNESIKLRFDHCPNLTTFLQECQSLEELTVKSPICNLDKILLDFLAFRNLKRLRKLTLDFGLLLIPKEQVQHLKNLPSLTHLEFNMAGYTSNFQEELGGFFEEIKKNRKLQVFKFNLYEFDEEDLISIQRCSRKLLRELPSLKAILFEIEESCEMLIFQGRCCWSEIEDILATEPLRERKIKLEKISY